MKKQSKNRRKKKEELINSILTLNIDNLKLNEEVFHILIRTIEKVINKFSIKEIYQKKSSKNKFILYWYLIILIIISTIFKVISQNSIINGNSIITLKVSQNGNQKIFNRGTYPDEVWINDYKMTSVTNYYSLNTDDNVTLIWTNEINNCNGMFKDCNSIIEINFTDFDAKKCIEMIEIFKNCSSLISLDFSGFKTSNLLKSMANMFWDCKSLISLNLSTFDTSEVTNMGHIFYNCESLKWIDISNFNTEKVNYLDNMFNGCKNLTSVNLSNFNTSQVISFDYMFCECQSLKIIDFFNLDVTSVIDINVTDNVFSNCLNLEYINIQNLNSNINLNNKF